MNRKTSEDWSNEQSKDHNDTKPVTLETIESKTQMTSLSQMLIYESGRSDYRRLSDIDLCKEIDTAIQNNWGKVSIYTLPYKDKIGLAEELRTRYHLGEAQLYRCLAMGY